MLTWIWLIIAIRPGWRCTITGFNFQCICALLFTIEYDFCEYFTTLQINFKEFFALVTRRINDVIVNLIGIESIGQIELKNEIIFRIFLFSSVSFCYIIYGTFCFTFAFSSSHPIKQLYYQNWNWIKCVPLNDDEELFRVFCDYHNVMFIVRCSLLSVFDHQEF